MAAPRRPRVLRVKIDNVGLKGILRNYITDDILDVAEQILPDISRIYTDEQGAPYVWKIKHDKGARVSRMYAVIYCESPEPKYKEAKHGDIAKYLKSISTKTKIRIQYSGGGISIG